MAEKPKNPAQERQPKKSHRPRLRIWENSLSLLRYTPEKDPSFGLDPWDDPIEEAEKEIRLWPQ